MEGRHQNASLILYTMYVDWDLSCKMDFTNFPVDNQVNQKVYFLDWLHQHLLNQFVTDPQQLWLIFSLFCSLVPAWLHQKFEGNFKEHLNLFLLKKLKSVRKIGKRAGQNLVVHKRSFKFPSNFWHNHTTPDPCQHFLPFPI